jgi:GTP-binding protein
MSLHGLFQNTQFLTAATTLHQAPPDHHAEIAFAGRSNAGKSSAINALCYQKRLARTSKTPGRTQQLIFFQLDAQRRLVDLPGYGFARVSLTIKQAWQQHMSHYLQQRQSLCGLVLVMDIRHPLTTADQHLLEWGLQAQLPLLLLLTKADKLSRAATQSTIARVNATINPELVTVLAFSVPAKQGIDATQQWLDDHWRIKLMADESSPL